MQDAKIDCLQCSGDLLGIDLTIVIFLLQSAVDVFDAVH
jgi:hypothetical protein